MSGCIPAIVSSVDVSFGAGISGNEGRRLWSRLSKKARKRSRISSVVAGPRAQLETHAVSLRGARLHRPAGEVDRVKLRYRSRAVPCRVAGDARQGRLALELLEPVDGAAPGQTACLLRGEDVVGWGTIAAG